MKRRTLAVLEVDGVSIIPVHTTFTVFAGSMVDAPQTLARRLVTAVWVTQVNVTTTLTFLTSTSDFQRVSPVPDLTAITINNNRITINTLRQLLTTLNVGFCEGLVHRYGW